MKGKVEGNRSKIDQKGDGKGGKRYQDPSKRDKGSIIKKGGKDQK